MVLLDVRAGIEIDRDPHVVRRQFADVEHHERAGVHSRVSFEVIDDDGGRCRYRQTTRLGPIRLRQTLLLPRTEYGPLVNTVVAGQAASGTISFDVQPVPGYDDRSHIEARLVAELTGLRALLALILRHTVARALSKALREDKHDLEDRGYGTLAAPPSA